MTTDLEAMHDLDPVVNRLPGEPVPYYLANGEGRRYELDDLLHTIIARAADTGGLFDAAYITGGRGSAAPFHAHAHQHRSFYVCSGSVQVWLGRSSRILVPGDSVHAPAGTPVAYRMLAHVTKLLTWAAPGGSVEFAEKLGTPVRRRVHSGRSTSGVSGRQREGIAAPLGITFPAIDPEPVRDHWDAALPQGVEPYFLRAGEGDRRETGDSLNTYLVRGANTAGNYFAVDTFGTRSQYFIRHFHQRHTESFVCLSGRIWLYVNGREVLLTEGDFVHAPAGTIHTFAFDAHNTRMLGILTPDVFEAFFDVTGRPTDLHVHPDGPAELATDPAELAASDLDLVVVGPPPQRMAGLDV
ncbi:MAG: quercetin 2,3-dioxygenase [Saccharopolyspora sp.]|uniref:quercetin 2,3-dioxygenase n=1 Tax=Saccharopolyspora sp. TaxID=33915 RepID=UPI0025DF0DBB|nr:quercetin 2,3-dioxygenase [Saccharopolyspora sp.]MBQ6639527.1 quercetin 2,3-dioxygenase [Saccharopolyspora sp.]